MEDIKVGTDVYWVQRTKTREIERVGKVIGVVQPECSPNNIIPGYVRDTISLRNFKTYLVKLYGANAIFWPGTVVPLPESKRHLILEQAPVTTSRTFLIDHNDRLKIKKVCKELGADFTESENYLNVTTWGKRFVFRVLGGVEFISYIENIKLV